MTMIRITESVLYFEHFKVGIHCAYDEADDASLQLSVIPEH